MNKIAVAIAFLFIATGAYAQGHKSIKDIDKELKQTKSTATAMALIESIAETVPRTDEEVAVLGQLMDKYPAQGQKALIQIKDPKLAKAVMKECDRQVAKFTTDKDKNWKTLSDMQRAEKFTALMNTQVMISMLGNVKSREALPYLKKYVSPEYDGTLSYSASQAIGKIAPDDSVVFKELWDKQGIKNIHYGAYRRSVLKEIAEKMQDPKLSTSEKTKLLGRSQIELRGATDPEEKKLLKDLLRNHPYAEMREVAGQSLMHSMRSDFTSEDKLFLKQWLSQENDGSVGWALYVVRDHWDATYIPELLKISRKSRWGGARARAIRLLRQNKVKEALPYLEDCVVNDKDANVRGDCREAYYDISGGMPSDFNPVDVRAYEANSINPVYISYYAKLKPWSPEKKGHDDLKKAMEDYRKRHK